MSIVASLMAVAAVGVAPGVAQAVELEAGGAILEAEAPIHLEAPYTEFTFSYWQWTCQVTRLDGTLQVPSGEFVEIELTEVEFKGKETQACPWGPKYDPVTVSNLPWILRLNDDGTASITGVEEKPVVIHHFEHYMYDMSGWLQTTFPIGEPYSFKNDLILDFDHEILGPNERSLTSKMTVSSEGNPVGAVECVYLCQ
jgi:hypothetical protein